MPAKSFVLLRGGERKASGRALEDVLLNTDKIECVQPYTSTCTDKTLFMICCTRGASYIVYGESLMQIKDCIINETPMVRYD